MKDQRELEAYLAKMEKALSSISVSDRADIITEIKSHVLMSQEKHPDQTVRDLLSSLGEPETVANRFLMERGLKPGKAPKSPMIKWLTIGFLGTVALFVFLVIVICWSFTPIIHIDGAKGELKLLGGLISINDDESDSHDDSNGRAKGQRDIDLKVVKSINVEFRNGKYEVRQSDDSKISWDCRYQGKGFDVEVDEASGIATLDMSDAKGSSCDLVLPKVAYRLDGLNGNVNLIEPVKDVTIDMTNGKISLKEAPHVKYAYVTDVTHGVKSNFTSSSAADAVKINIKLVNGVIHKD